MPGSSAETTTRAPGTPVVGGGEERIGRHVQPDVLHRHHRRRAAEGRAEGHLEGHLFVGRPFGVAAEGVKVFENLGRGRAGVSGAQGHAGVARRQGHGFISAQELHEK